jgi:hypothetical protein
VVAIVGMRSIAQLRRIDSDESPTMLAHDSPSLRLAQTVSRQILIPPTETGSHVDRDRFAFVADTGCAFRLIQSRDGPDR